MSQTRILLTTLNATYQHCAFGLRYLYANLGELKSQATLREFTLAQATRDIVENILELNPRIIGFGVYIWNTREIEEVVRMLKKVRPDITIVLGGPEVSYETEGQSLVQVSDYVIKGEGELLFRDLCEGILNYGRFPETKLLSGILPKLETLALPYQYYTGEDIRNRVIYVEASRGCPYKCEFCLSSLDTSVRNFPLKPFLFHMEELIERGCRQFKFVDRTFNLSPQQSSAILEFFLQHIDKGLFLHFEMVPDRLPDSVKELIQKFPPGSLQFEIGIQTWDPEVSRLISRKQDFPKTEENLKFLKANTHAHIHADLIAGLPGETLETFGEGFNRLFALKPHEIQVGILKRLKGTPICRHDEAWAMVYEENPPFAILQTRTMPFTTLQKIVRYSKFWDLYANRGQFPRFIEALFNHRLERCQSPFKREGNTDADNEKELSSLSLEGRLTPFKTPFEEFWRFSEFLNERHPQRHSIALQNLAESAFVYLIEVKGLGKSLAREILMQDYCFGRVSRDVPVFLRDETLALPQRPDGLKRRVSRQERHLPH